MKYAIIAAGEGSRLQQEGVNLPKPLVRIGGESMIDRLIRIFRNNGAEEICIIVNTLHPQTYEHLRSLQAEGKADDLRIVVKSTPSSMHSFAELAPYLTDAPFCLTTVDTIFREEEFSRYISHFLQSEADGCMAVTDFIDVVAWRKTAEFVSRYFSKGKMIIVEGSLRNNDYTDANGVKHYSMDVQADNVSFGESKSASAAATGISDNFQQPVQQQQTQASPKPVPAQNQPAEESIQLGDLSDFEEILSDGEVPF